MNFQALIETLPQVILYVIIAPWVVGMLHWSKARLQKRRGRSPFQPYRDLWKLFHRQAVLPETASWVFSAAPMIVFGCYVLIGGLIPIVFLPSFEQIFGSAGGPPQADFLVVVALVGLARFVLGLAGMDTGSPFGGLGSSREMFIYFLTEPVLILMAYALALNDYTTSLSGAMSTQTGSSQALPYLANPSLFLVSFALVLVILADAGRMPLDNPAANLELSMVGKAVQLEYSGYLQAFLEWGEAMRMTFFLTLFINLFVPGLLASPEKWDRVNVLFVLLYPLKLMVVIQVLALWEETRARLRLRGVSGMSGLGLVLSVFAIFLVFLMHYFVY